MSYRDKLSSIEATTRSLVESTFTAWANRDLDAVCAALDDDIVHVLNVDDHIAPFPASTIGKKAIREKFQLLMDTFEFGAFVTDFLAVNGNVARARMKLIYIHNVSGERLKTDLRFVITQHDRLITRIEEYHDAPYLEAFFRLIARPQDL